MIITDEHGRPFEKPTPPAKNCSVEDTIAYLRACARHADALAACGSNGFARAFRAAMKGHK